MTWLMTRPIDNPFPRTWYVYSAARANKVLQRCMWAPLWEEKGNCKSQRSWCAYLKYGNNVSRSLAQADPVSYQEVNQKTKQNNTNFIAKSLGATCTRAYPGDTRVLFGQAKRPIEKCVDTPLFSVLYHSKLNISLFVAWRKLIRERKGLSFLCRQSLTEALKSHLKLLHNMRTIPNVCWYHGVSGGNRLPLRWKVLET